MQDLLFLGKITRLNTNANLIRIKVHIAFFFSEFFIAEMKEQHCNFIILKILLFFTEIIELRLYHQSFPPVRNLETFDEKMQSIE